MPIKIEREIASPYVKAVITYWAGLRGERRAPQVNEVDPVDISPSALPYILLSEVFDDPFRVRYRLVGSHNANLFGDFKGAYLDELELPSEIYQLLTQDYAYAARTCEPVLGRYAWPKNHGCPVTVEYVLLPLLDGDRVRRFLAAEHISNDVPSRPLCAEDLLPLGWRRMK